MLVTRGCEAESKAWAGLGGSDGDYDSGNGGWAARGSGRMTTVRFRDCRTEKKTEKLKKVNKLSDNLKATNSGSSVLIARKLAAT